jgi:hypothetical protein
MEGGCNLAVMIVFFSQLPLSFSCVCGSHHLLFEEVISVCFESEMTTYTLLLCIYRIESPLLPLID